MLIGLRRWLQGRALWLDLVVTAGLTAAIVCAAEAAFPGGSVAFAIAPTPIVAAAASWKDRQFWRLTRDDRLTVVDAMRSGISTGSPTLDQLARARLIRRASSFRTDRVITPVIALVAAAMPVLAALRTGNGCWLAVEAPISLPLLILNDFGLQDPRPPLTSLTRNGA